MSLKEILGSVAILLQKTTLHEKAALALIALFIILFFKPVVSGDGFGYYAILEGIGMYGSLDLANGTRFNEIAGANYVFFNEETGRFVSKYAPGVALFSLPLYKLSLFLDDFPLFHLKDSFFLQERGDILVRMASLPVTSLLFFLLALLCTLYLCKKYYAGNVAWIALLAAFFGTPMLRYATYDLSYSHAIEAGLFALLVLLFLKRPKPLLLGAVLGLLTITRYTAGIFVLPLLAFFLWKREKANAARLLLGFVPFIAALLFYFNFQFGSFLSAGYHAGFGSVVPLHLLEIFLDLNRGIIFWTPMVVLAIVGLFCMKDRKKYVLLSFFALNTLVYACWMSWHSAWAFGNRFFAMFFVLYAIGTAALLSEKPQLKPVVLGLTAYTFFLGLLFFAQAAYLFAPYNFTDTIRYWFLDGNIITLPAKIAEKISIARFVLAP
jgi:hypothetical protein